jgi:mRNA interferase RelE/StbE
LAYKVQYAPAAWKAIAKFDKPTQKRILEFVDKIEASINPRFSGKALVGSNHEWRYRVGDYRLVCEIKDEELIVWIVKVAHRREVYR